MSDVPTSVIFGAGPLGLAVTRHLASGKGPVRTVTRSGRADVPAGVEVLAADLADPEQARRAAAGADVVYHCASPPYHRWPELHPPLMAAAIAAGAATGAKVVFGDNLYAYGPVDGPLTEDLPYRPHGPNGRTRAEIAEALLAAHRKGEVHAVIGRASDFFGPHARLSVVGDQVFARALAGKPARALGNPDLPHSVTYLDDFARALVDLAAREDAAGQVWHIPSPPPVTIRRFVQMVFADVERPVRLRTAPRWGIGLAALFSPTMRAVKEQLYQHERPWVVDSTKFERAFGWTAAPLPDAIRDTVAWYRAHQPTA